MRILITGTTGESMPPPYGGVPKLSLLVARAWRSQGHSAAITFVYRPTNADDLGANAEYFFEYAARPTKFKKAIFLAQYFFRNPRLYLTLFHEYRKIYPHLDFEVALYPAYGVYMDGVISTFKPDVILSEAALIQTFMVAKVAKRRYTPVIFDTYAEIHDLSMGTNSSLTEGNRKNYWKSFLSLADLVIAPGPHCCRGPLMYLPKEKVEYVYDGSDYSIANLDIDEDQNVLRDILNLPRDLFLIGNVGSFELRKGHDHLIKAISKLTKAGHAIGAVICGGTGDATKWRNLAKAEGVADRVFFFGRLPELELGRVLKSLDCFSDLENTPRACGLTMAVLEGMAMGNPVVIYENREMFEVVKEEENGFIVPLNDIDALAAAILKMQQLPAEVRKEMGKKAAAAARQIDITFTADGKMKLFQQVLNSYNAQ
ncbi:glycosyltransferase [Candidatus Kaiserbacteria bacterium]|nr:glycosyltransferase [Candidatus Kaiserbacteria bacterium]